MKLVALALALAFGFAIACGDEPVHARELGYCYADAWAPCEVDVPEIGWCEATYKGQRWAQRLHAAQPCAPCPACEAMP